MAHMTEEESVRIWKSLSPFLLGPPGSRVLLPLAAIPTPEKFQAMDLTEEEIKNMVQKADALLASWGIKQTLKPFGSRGLLPLTKEIIKGMVQRAKDKLASQEVKPSPDTTT